MRLFALLAAISLAHSASSQAESRQLPVPFYDPTINGGSMLDTANDGLGEPLNVIVSGLSSPEVLTVDGFRNYARAIGFSDACLGIEEPNPFTADLGDGQGVVPLFILYREDYGSASFGTCLETLLGGNHFRGWMQNGTQADSHAIFLATSLELNGLTNHNIAPNGYNVGRDALVARALGKNSFGGVTYLTQAQSIVGLLPPGTADVNHNISTDGVTSVLTVYIV
ncbi:hypothetical protein B0H21DRAFT_860757 [Amylocystis lapponica]|nr:hypothetical protein B0H21DRAFT_860757 [Amylocystis lapponica]